MRNARIIFKVKEKNVYLNDWNGKNQMENLLPC